MRKCIAFFLTVLLFTLLAFSQAKKVRVTADRATLYYQPKTRSLVLDKFKQGTILNVLGSGEKSGWYNVTGKSQRSGGLLTGFVLASQVKLIDETPKPASETIQEVPKILEAAKAQEAKKPTDEKPAVIKKAAKVQEVNKPEEEKQAKIEEPVKAEEVAKPGEIVAGEKSSKPVATEKMPRRKAFSIRLGYNAGFSTQNQSVSWSKVIYYENAAFGINYAAQKGNSFSAGLGYKFSHSVGVEVGIDIASRNLNASCDASIPNPLYFNSPRTAQSKASYKISENAAYLDFVLTVPFSRFGLDFSAGPAYFFSSAELIGAIQYSQSYPYSSIAISAQSQKFSKNVFGFNAGASLIFNFTEGVGIFLSGRYFSGSADLKPTEIPGLKLSLGGLKAGGGIKISF